MVSRAGFGFWLLQFMVFAYFLLLRNHTTVHNNAKSADPGRTAPEEGAVRSGSSHCIFEASVSGTGNGITFNVKGIATCYLSI